MTWSALLLALRETRRDLLRYFLALLGIVIGVSAVVTMAAPGKGPTQAVQDRVSSPGSSLPMARPGQRHGRGGADGTPTLG